MANKILIIEDDPRIVDILQFPIRDLGLELDHAPDGELGLQMAKNGNYKLFILDLNLPQMNGLKVCQGIREFSESTPIIILTSSGEDADKVAGFNLGADDYLAKPFSIPELLARVRALLRRASLVEDCDKQKNKQGLISIGDFYMDLDTRTIQIQGNPIELTAMEFNLLATLAAKPGRVFTKEDLIKQVWGYASAGHSSTVIAQVNKLRKKLEPDPENPRYIETIWGVGYKFIDNT